MLKGKPEGNNMKYKKNNEGLNKYVAGLFDGDGTIYVREDGRGKLRLTMEIVFNLNEPKVEETMLELYDHYNFGRLDRKPSKNVTLGYWVIEGMACMSMFNTISKHCVIKATHGARIIKLWLEVRDGRKFNYDAVKKYLYLSRRNTTSFKHKKHFNWAWLAGYIDADGYIGYKQEIYTGIRFGAHTIKDKSALELIAYSTGRPLRECDDGCSRLDIHMSRKTRATAQKYLPKLLPHLRFKKWNAEQLLRYCKNVSM